MATSNETGSRFDPQSPTFLLDLKNLQVAFSGAAPAVRNVSLTVRPGETVALVGESGSGKSVTSLAVMGLLEAEGGKIEAGEILLRTKEGAVVDMRCASEKTRRAVRGRDAAMIFQEPMRSLNPVMTVGEQIAEALRKDGLKDAERVRAETVALLERVRIPDAALCAKRYPHMLSGGMRQRVAVLRAMRMDADFLLLDEPFRGLDAGTKKKTMNYIRRKGKEKTMLLVTHDLEEAEAMGDWICTCSRLDGILEIKRNRKSSTEI